MKKVFIWALAVSTGVLAIDPTFPTVDPSSTTSSSTSSSSPPTTTPIFIFNDFETSDVDTCSSFMISWVYGGKGPVKGYTLSVTNINVTQSSPPAVASSSSSQSVNTFSDGQIPTNVRRDAILPSLASGSVYTSGTVAAPSGTSSPLPGFIESLTTTLDPSNSDSLTWNPVNLPQGWYAILLTPTDAGDAGQGVGGIWTSFIKTSPSFFVRNGSDTSCLATTPVSTGTSPSSSQTSTSPQSVPTNVGSISSSKVVNRGAIAGGVVGGVAVLVAVLAAFLVLRHGGARRRKDREGDVSDVAGGGSGGSAKPRMGKWGALGSFDSSNGSSRSMGRSTGAKNGVDPADPVTILNTAANGRPQKSGGFGLGGLGLAALGLAKDQNSPPSAFTGQPKRSRKSRQLAKHDSAGTVDSTGAMTSTTFTDASSGHGHYDPYGNFARGYSSMATTREGEEELYSPQEKGVPLRTLSPTSPTEEYQQYPGYPPSSDMINSADVGGIPYAYEPSPFVTPPPSEPASRHNSRSYSKSSLTNVNASDQLPAAIITSDPSSSSEFQTTRARSQSQNSPTSPRSARPPDIPESPGNDAHTRRASSPDALVYTLDRQPSGSLPKSGQTKRTPRKPVPSYTLEEQQEPPLPLSPKESSYPQPQSSRTASNSKSTSRSARRPAPSPPSESASSSSSSFHPSSAPRAVDSYSHLHGLVHKDSEHSLASLRNMEGDMSAYNAVLGKEGAKQMHVLMPDMPLSQH